MESDISNDLTYDLENLRDSIGIGSADLSETTDLTSAKALIMKPNDNTKYIIQMYFIPEAKVQEATEKDKKNYLEWAKKGYVHICSGNEVDYSDVVAWFVMLYKKYNIRLFKVGYDKWNAKSFVSDYGFDMERINQDFNGLSSSMKLVEADLKSNNINYNQNPIDRWCLINTVAKVNTLGQIMPIKPNDTGNKRIDGALTFIIAYATLDKYKREYMNLIR